MEKLYAKLNSAGIGSLVMGIIIISVGLSTGILMIINGARLLSSKKDIIF